MTSPLPKIHPAASRLSPFSHYVCKPLVPKAHYFECTYIRTNPHESNASTKSLYIFLRGSRYNFTHYFTHLSATWGINLIPYRAEYILGTKHRETEVETAVNNIRDIFPFPLELPITLTHRAMAIVPPDEKSDKPKKKLEEAIYICVSQLRPSGVNVICGGISGIVSAVVTCPFDVIKTRLQNQKHSMLHGEPKLQYQGFIGTGRTIVQTEGLKALYRGLGPMTLGYVPTWAVYMSMYEASRDYFHNKVENKSLSRVYSSIVAGACATTLTNPVWVIKTRFMAQSSNQQMNHQFQFPYYRSTLDAARSMYRTEGVRAFYSGLSPAILGLLHVMIQFPLYELLKTEFTGMEMGENPQNHEEGHFVGVLGAILISKGCASVATYPHEVLRTRLQTQHYSPNTGSEGTSGKSGYMGKSKNGGVFTLLKTLIREEGWRTLYAGMGTNLIRAMPAAVSMMLTFEMCKSAIGRMQGPASNWSDTGTESSCE